MEVIMSILSTLYLDIYKYLIENNGMRKLPLEINDIFYDPKYTSPYDIEILQTGDIVIDESFFYSRLFNYINSHMKNLVCITNSFSLNEDEELIGDYFYYAGTILPDIPLPFINVPFLYEMSSHPMYYPNRIIIFDPFFQIEISSDRQAINVHEINMNARKIFLSCDKKEMVNWLMETDRPCLEHMVK